MKGAIRLKVCCQSRGNTGLTIDALGVLWKSVHIAAARHLHAQGTDKAGVNVGAWCICTLHGASHIEVDNAGTPMVRDETHVGRTGSWRLHFDIDPRGTSATNRAAIERR